MIVNRYRYIEQFEITLEPFADRVEFRHTTTLGFNVKVRFGLKVLGAIDIILNPNSLNASVLLN